MKKHLKDAHTWTGGHKGGRPPKASVAQNVGFTKVTTSPVSYQTFHRSNFIRFFQVTPPLEIDRNLSKPSQQPLPTTLKAQVELQLAQKLQAANTIASLVLQSPSEPLA
jgi:hypothetical protein